MNIFFLDNNPKKAAEYMCDKHVCKMIIESTQMLANPYYYQHGIFKMKDVDASNQHLVDSSWLGFPRDKPYRISFAHHPCSVWVASSKANWYWLYEHAIELCNQYKLRYGKEHSSLPKLLWMGNNTPLIINIGLTTPAQAMPDKHKNKDAVIAYQTYYIHEKNKFAKWKLGNIPYFWIVV